MSMARKQQHYMLDLIYRLEGQLSDLRTESHLIVASSDSEAIRESKIATIGALVKPTLFRVRKVFRKSEEVIYDSSKVVPNA
jgi:hypothetical protein